MEKAWWWSGIIAVGPRDWGGRSYVAANPVKLNVSSFILFVPAARRVVMVLALDCSHGSMMSVVRSGNFTHTTA